MIEDNHRVIVSPKVVRESYAAASRDLQNNMITPIIGDHRHVCGHVSVKRARVDDEVKWAVSVQPRIVTALELRAFGT